MSSSLDTLADSMINLFTRLYSPTQQMGNGSRFSQSTGDINNIFNDQSSKQDQVEASFYLTTLLGKRYFTLDNNTIDQLPQMMIKAASNLRSGTNYNYTKMTDKMSVTIGFPMAMGLPFVFTIKNPTLMMLSGSATAQTEPDVASRSPMPPGAVNMTADLHLVYSSHTQSKMGFIAPFNKQHYISGVSKNIQVNIPVRNKIDVDFMNRKIFTEMEPLDGTNKHNVFEYSTVPYTAKRNILDVLKTPQKEMQPDSDKIIHVKSSAEQIHRTFGQDSTGFAFEFDYRTEQNFIDFTAFYNEAQKHDPLSAIIYAWAEDSIKYNNITLTFNPQKSTAQYAKFAAALLDDSDSIKEGSLNNTEDDSGLASASMAQTASTSFNSHERQQEFLFNVGAGIQDSSKMVLDLSAKFQGQNNASFVCTFAAATSFTSPKARYLFFANKDPIYLNPSDKQSQVCLTVETVMPIVPLMNFAKALAADPTSNMSAEMTVGEKCSHPSTKIIIKGKMKQSQERHQMMEQMPMAQMCKEQMQEGNSVLSACRNVTMQANCMDQYKFSLKFDKVSDFWKNMTYKMYSAMRFVGHQYVSEDLISHNNPNDTVELDASYAPDLSSVNVTIKAPMLSAQFSDLRVNRMVQELLIVNPEYSAVQRAAEYMFQGQQFPTCVVGSNRAETFDNKIYPVNLGHCWHLMVQYIPKMSSDISASDNIRNVSVFVRDSLSSNNKEVKIIIGGNTFHLEPYQVTVNGQPIEVLQEKLSHAQDDNGQILAQMYRLPSGAIRMFAQRQNMELQYDGVAVKIRAPNSYRSRVHGLCGTFNSQSADDFTTPAKCVVQDAHEFASLYTVVDTTCQGPSQALRPQAQQSPCFQNKVSISKVVTGSEVYIDELYSPSKKLKKILGEKYSSCTYNRTVMVEKEDMICFSLKAQVHCTEICRPQALTNKQVDVFCTDRSTITQFWGERIQQGAMLGFNQKLATPHLSIYLDIPENCIPK